MSTGNNGSPNWMWITAGSGSGCERGHASNAPSIATGTSGTAARRERAKAGLEPPDFAVFGTGSFREHQYQFFALQPLERFLDSAQAEPFAIQRNRIE